MGYFSNIRKVAPGERPSAAHVNAIVDALNNLGRVGTTGFGSSMHGSVEMMHEKFPGRTELVQITDHHIHEDDLEGLIVLVKFNPGSSIVYAPSEQQRKIRKDQWPGLPLLIGEQFTARYHQQTGEYIPVDPPMVRRVKLKADLKKGLSATADVLYNHGSGDVDLTAVTITVWEGLAPAGLADPVYTNGTIVTAIYLRDSNRWYVVGDLPTGTIVNPGSDIPALSGSTPGSGSGEVYSFDGTSLADSSAAITVFNLSKQVARASTFYECIYINGYAFIVNTGSTVTMFEGTIYGMDLASTATSTEVIPTLAIWGPLPSASPITAQNDYSLQGKVGKPCLVVQADSGTYYLIQIQPPSDVLFEASLGSTLLTTDGFATVDVTAATAIFGEVPTGPSISARNDFKTSGNFGDKCLVAEDILDNYYLIPTTSPNHTLFWATLGGPIDETVASQSVTPTIGIFGALPPAAVTAWNTPLLTAQNGGLVLIAGTAGASPTYYIVRVAPAVMFLGTTATLLSTDATAAVTPATAIYGPLPGSPVSAQNVLNLSSNATKNVIVAQAESGLYYLLAVVPAIGSMMFEGQLASTLAITDLTASVSLIAPATAPTAQISQSLTGITGPITRSSIILLRILVLDAPGSIGILDFRSSARMTFDWRRSA
jgi:hypothetical protein